jgi:hypothetical protein
MAKSLQQTVQNWTNSAGTAQANYTAGVQATNVDVVGRAVANAGAAVTNYTTAITSGLWAARLQAVGTAGWKAATVAKATNYATGFAAGATKYNNAMSRWLPIIDAAAAQVNSMPSGSIAASKARVNAFMDILHNAKLQGV